MTTSNPFVLEKTAYVRDLNVVKMYVDQATRYLMLSTGEPEDTCRDFILEQMKPGGKLEFKDPTVYYLQRNDTGDRDKKAAKLSEYLGSAIRDGELIAPTFTTYLNPKVIQSVLVDFIDANVKARNVAKKAMFVAKMAKNAFLEFLKKCEQGLKKISNNSISGGHVSNSTPLFNKTAHSTLTSNCRTTSGFGNANNEKFLCGNRHYWNPKIALNNIVSIITNSNFEKIERAMKHYGIRVPTVEETMECITYSTNLYWPNNRVALAKIRDLVEKLSDLERSAFVYTGDLYHLAKHNDGVVRNFLDRLTSQVRVKVEDPNKLIHSHREEYLNLASQLFYTEMKGKKVKDTEGTDLHHYIAATVDNINATIQDHALLIDAFWVTDNVPASLAFFPDSIRRAALTSDTDSTIFTVQDWVFWHHGDDPGFNDKTYATGSTMIFLAAETITHILARMSANFGIETERIHQVAMKNEFRFDVFVPTQVGKHYFAYISCQEGNILDEFDMEKKGVHLKSSNVPKVITKQAEDMMREIMDTVISGKKISLRGILTKVADIERTIKASVIAGESTYFRGAQIKTADSYTKSAEESPYQHYTLWQEVFAPKYGDAPVPPYQASKVCVEVKSGTSMKAWIAGIKDRELAARLENWATRNNKTGIQALLLPIQNLEMKGMPEEIVPVMDMRKTIFDNTGVFYLILESLGFYVMNDSLTRLAIDEY